MKVIINQETCELSGKCTYFHPELFVERDDGHPELRVTEIGEEQRQAVLDAIDACPTASISLVEEDAAAGG